MLSFIFLLTILLPSSHQAHMKAIYNSLKSDSISQHLNFYTLYPHTQEGQLALVHAYHLLFGNTYSKIDPQVDLPQISLESIHSLLSLIHRAEKIDQQMISPSAISLIQQCAQRLKNTNLAGRWALSEEEVLQIPEDQIDLSRALLLSQFTKEERVQMAFYEASLDMMALQILASLPQNPSPEKILQAISQFVFYDMEFRFPPHSCYAKEIDLYTFLPSVLDGRKGVCLGISILYISLAQRLGLDLEMVTPPGHIFVRWKNGDRYVNIETTARGIHIENEEYLGVETCSLQTRSIKEVVGLAHFNQASLFWEKGLYEQALESYSKASKYLPNDPLLRELQGYVHLFKGDLDEGKKILKEIVNISPEHAVTKRTISEDYLNGKVSAEGIRVMFEPVDETRESLLKKKKNLEELLKEYPDFREGILALATTWMQLHRNAEALEQLQKFHSKDRSNASVEYYIAAISYERKDFPKAWKHLRLAEKLTLRKHHFPIALLELKRKLMQESPNFDENNLDFSNA